MNIARYEPFADTRSFFAREAFDDLVRSIFVRPTATSNTQAVRPNVDVSETQSHYVVHADLPGMKKEDIAVTVDGDVLTIAAETKSDAESKDGDRVVYRERSAGKWSRSFRLGTEIDLARAEAKYENGVLALTLPKRETEAVKKLAIQ
jgi:HSP20 family protein